VIARLNAEFTRLFAEPRFVTFLEKQAVVSAPTSPGEFAAFLKKDRQAAETLVKIANTKPEEYKAGQ
jgi:tripartite-type tricarboxylate transporter receptor subunit TctC